MIQDFFRDGTTSAVAATAAAGFVGLLSLFNMGGRFVWSTTSDYIGRKPIYMVYLGGGIVLTSCLATLGSTATWIFVLTAALIISLLRRRLRHRPGLPARPLRHLPGGRDPRPPADRLVGRRRRRAADRQHACSTPGAPRVSSSPPTTGRRCSSWSALLAVGFVANLLIKPVAVEVARAEVRRRPHRLNGAQPDEFHPQPTGRTHTPRR